MIRSLRAIGFLAEFGRTLSRPQCTEGSSLGALPLLADVSPDRCQPDGQVASVPSGSVHSGWKAGPSGEFPEATVPIGAGAWKYCVSPQYPGNCTQPGPSSPICSIGITAQPDPGGPAVAPAMV